MDEEALASAASAGGGHDCDSSALQASVQLVLEAIVVAVTAAVPSHHVHELCLQSLLHVVRRSEEHRCASLAFSLVLALNQHEH